MQVAIYILFVSIYITPYFHDLGFLPRQATWLSDGVAAGVGILAVYAAVTRKQIAIGFWYRYFRSWTRVGDRLLASAETEDYES